MGNECSDCYELRLSLAFYALAREQERERTAALLRKVRKQRDEERARADHTERLVESLQVAAYGDIAKIGELQRELAQANVALRANEQTLAAIAAERTGERITARRKAAKEAA